MADYEAVIGLETHAELLTGSKMFCSSPVVDSTSAAPNTAVNEVDTAQPGTLPVINKKAVEYAMMVGLALNCQINPFNMFDRKLYFYPDLPKGYQITQYNYPIATNGWIDIEVPADNAAGYVTKRIRINRAHMEEDTGKTFHEGKYSLVDLNRAGVPLLEIVTEPDFRTPEEVEVYARKLRSILVYLGVNHGDMSKGVLRFEANISVREVGAPLSDIRTEVKNLNSIRSLVRASEYEIERQIKLVKNGERVLQQTMGFDDSTGKTRPQRSKEEAHDYRYFPEPDLPPLMIGKDWIETVRAELPALPDLYYKRFTEEYGLSRDDAGDIVDTKAIAEYFQKAVEADGDPQKVANWVTTEIFRYLNEDNTRTIEDVAGNVPPENLVELIALTEKDVINSNTAKDVFNEMIETGKTPAKIVDERGLAQISDTSALEAIVEAVIANNPDEVATYVGGKDSIIGWFVGQVMRETRGKANAGVVSQMLRERLDALRD